MSRQAARPRNETFAAAKQALGEVEELVEELVDVARSSSGTSVGSRGRGSSKEGTPARGAKRPRKPRIAANFGAPPQ